MSSIMETAFMHDVTSSIRDTVCPDYDNTGKTAASPVEIARQMGGEKAVEIYKRQHGLD